MHSKDLTNLHKTIHSLIGEEVATNQVSYNKERPYQSYERIQFEGLRWSVEKRIREYGLSQYFNSEKAILDIGSNFGFFVCEFAMHCLVVHGVEPTSHLNAIGRAVAKYLGISNRTQFFNTTFDSFKAPTKYDTVLSLASFYTQDGRERSSSEHYFEKIAHLLNPKGQIFYESTSYTKDSNDPHFVAQSSAIKAIEKYFGDIQIWETPSGSKGYFRRFVTGKK